MLRNHNTFNKQSTHMICDIFFQKQVHKFSLEREASLHNLNKQINKVFLKLPARYMLTYKDEEGDDVTLGNNKDLKILVDSGIQKPNLYIQETSLDFFDQTEQFLLQNIQQNQIIEQVQKSEVKVVKPEKKQVNKKKLQKQEKKFQSFSEQQEKQYENEYCSIQYYKHEEQPIIDYRKNCKQKEILVGKVNLSPKKISSVSEQDKKPQKLLNYQGCELISKKSQLLKVDLNEFQIERREQNQELYDFCQQNGKKHKKSNQTSEIEIQTQLMYQQQASGQKKQKKTELPHKSIQYQQIQNIKASIAEIKQKLQKSESAHNAFQIKDNKSNTQLHANIACDMCYKKPIIGVRYRCQFCQNYNLCQNCEDTEDHGHPFIKIKKAVLCPKIIKAQMEAEIEQLRKKEAQLAAEKKKKQQEKIYQIARQKMQTQKFYKKKEQQGKNKKEMLAQKEKNQKLQFLSEIFNTHPKQKLKDLIKNYPYFSKEELVNYCLENQKSFGNTRTG